MSWVERLRISTNRVDAAPASLAGPSPSNDNVEGSSERRSGLISSSVALLDVAVWVEILTLISYRDICALSATCRGLSTFSFIDYVWSIQERQLLQDVAEARGLPPPPLLSSGTPTSLPAGESYKKFKLTKVLLAKDVRREWDLKELTARRYQGARAAVTLSQRPELQIDGVLTRSLTTMADGRILKSELHLYDLVRPHSEMALKPHQLQTACDDLSAGVDGRIGVFETTDAQEDPLFVRCLQVGLSATQAGNNMLHTLGPRLHLIEISSMEARSMQQAELATRRPEYNNLLEDFVIDPPRTRYFIGPELCRSGHCAGLVVIDAFRLLVVTCRDRD